MRPTPLAILRKTSNDLPRVSLISPRFIGGFVGYVSYDAFFSH
ncbi:MAG: hypothetical protein DRN59_03535 [Thaumarchaeota archaeon]|nr:MAG: hypothetical protein DRN59_03535 [Nitrososphaerota archaeon]